MLRRDAYLSWIMGITAATSCTPSAPEEPTASLLEKITVTDTATFGEGSVDLARRFTNFDGSTVALSGTTVVFTPSQELSTLLYMDNNGAAHTTKYPLPTVSFNPGGLWCTFYADINRLSVDLSQATITFAPSEVDLVVLASGNVRITNDSVLGVIPNADIVVDQATLKIAFSWNAGLQRVTATTAANIHDHVANCGAFGWCNGLMEGALPDMDGRLAKLVQDQLDPLLANGQTTSGFYEVLSKAWNAFNQGSGQPWALVPGTLSYDKSVFSYEVSRLVPPIAPACTVTTDTCDNVKFSCPTTTDTTTYQVENSDGSWGPPVSVWGPVSPSLDSSIVRFCNSNTLGTACGAPQSFTLDDSSRVSCGTHNLCGDWEDGCGGILHCPPCKSWCPPGYFDCGDGCQKGHCE